MLYVLSVTLDYYHTGQCKSTGGCYSEVVVAIFRTGADVTYWFIYKLAFIFICDDTWRTDHQ